MKHCMSGSGEVEHVPYSLRDGGGSWGALDNSYMAYTDRGASGVDVECTMPSRGWGGRCREDTYTLPDSYDAMYHSPEVA